MDDEDAKPKLRLASQVEVAGQMVKTRAELAYDMKLAGASLSDIAAELGYNSPGDVSQSIRSRLNVEASFLEESERENILQLEVARIDAVQAAHWQSMQFGDIRSSQIVLQCIALRAKLTKIDQIDAGAGQTTILVLGGTEDDYVKKLQELSS